MLAFAILITAVILLIILAIIDFRTFLLPNVFVFPFAALAPLFHYLTDFYYLSPMSVLIGGLVGYGLLYTIRAAGNRYYGQDSLGLGDVKLLGAGGLWLGAENVLFAMTVGAFFGLIHGLIVAIYNKVKTNGPFSFARLTIPAGPGFVFGIMSIGGWMYQDFIMRVITTVFY